MATPGYRASGTITVMSWLIADSSNASRCLLASGTTVPIIGVSGKTPRRPPVFSFDTTIHAIAGEDVEMHDEPQEWQVQLGGTVSPGDPLTSDGSGHAITASSGNYIGGYAVDGGVSGDVIRFRAEFAKI